MVSVRDTSAPSPTVSEDTAERLFGKFGGVPLSVLEKVSQADAEMTMAISNVTDFSKLISLCSSFSMGLRKSQSNV